MRGENELLSSGTGQAWNKMLKLTFSSGKKRSYKMLTVEGTDLSIF